MAQWDVFISHAFEDKDAIARPLAQALVRVGFSVWYDEFTLSAGDSLTQTINEGLENSSYGIVIVSEKFLPKKWPQRELAGMFAKEDRAKVILPVWHNVTEDEVRRKYPILADRVALRSTSSLDELVTGLLRAMNLLSVFEGAWTSSQHGGLYIIKRVGLELRGAYCFDSDHELTAHFFEVQVVDGRLLCRFRWFRRPIEGCVVLRLRGKNRLIGGWWYIEQLPRAAKMDLREVHDGLAPMNPLQLVRVPMPDPLPSWAVDYFHRAGAAVRIL